MARRNHSSILKQQTPRLNSEETKAQALENLELRRRKTTNAQNLTSFSKTNTNKKPFRTLNHHDKMEIALTETKLRTKLSSSNQQQPTAIRKQRKRNHRKSQEEEMKIRIGTHLTIIGVCTTIRPEKSGT